MIKEQKETDFRDFRLSFFVLCVYMQYIPVFVSEDDAGS